MVYMDIICGTFIRHEYGRVILPMTILKRLIDKLLHTKDAVLRKYEKVKRFKVKDEFLAKKNLTRKQMQNTIFT